MKSQPGIGLRCLLDQIARGFQFACPDEMGKRLSVEIISAGLYVLLHGSLLSASARLPFVPWPAIGRVF